MTIKNYTPINHLIEKVKKEEVASARPQTKEAEPISKAPEIIMEEVVEHRPEKEVAPFVKPRAETIKLPPDLKKIGARVTSTTRFPAKKIIQLPISDDKILVGLHAPITSSLRWLATLALYILKKAHLSLKKIHGKVVRVDN